MPTDREPAFVQEGPLRYNGHQGYGKRRQMRDVPSMTSVYLDVCCLNRPFDDQAQARIHLEAEAVLIILARCRAGDWTWVSSDVVDLEIERTPDPERCRRVRLLVSHAHRSVQAGVNEIERAEQLRVRVENPLTWLREME